MFRPIAITAVLNGWIVTVGCQTVVYQERDHLTRDLDSYLRDPDATEARILKGAVNAAHTMGGGDVGTVPAASTRTARDEVRQLGAAWDPTRAGSAPRG